MYTVVNKSCGMLNVNDFLSINATEITCHQCSESISVRRIFICQFPSCFQFCPFLSNLCKCKIHLQDMRSWDVVWKYVPIRKVCGLQKIICILHHWLTYSTISVSRWLLAVHLRLSEAWVCCHRTALSRLSSPSLKRQMKNWGRIAPGECRYSFSYTGQWSSPNRLNIPAWQHMK